MPHTQLHRRGFLTPCFSLAISQPAGACVEMLPRFQPGEVWQHLVRPHDPITVFMGVRPGAARQISVSIALQCCTLFIMS